MESRFIEGWRSRADREYEQARSSVWSAPRFVQILEDGHAVQYDNGQRVFIGRKTRVIFSRGADYEKFDSLRRERDREYMRFWWSRFKVEHPERWSERLKYIRDWELRFKAENPDRYKAQRKAIEERYRVKNREAINNRQRLKRVQISSEKKALSLFQHAVYAQLVQLAGLRKK